MAIVARRMTVLVLIMVLFALSFSALVNNHGRNAGQRMINAQNGCQQTVGCTAWL